MLTKELIQEYEEITDAIVTGNPGNWKISTPENDYTGLSDEDLYEAIIQAITWTY